MLVKTDSTRQRLSRRAFLRGLGVSAGFLPLLDAERALAATPGGFPKRLVTVTWTNGICQSAFFPASDNDPVSNQVLQPLAPLKAKVLVAAGLDYKQMIDTGHHYDGHFSYPVIFTGTYKNTGGQNCTSDGPSLDQTVSDAIAKQVSLPLPLLNVAVSGNSTSYRSAGQRNSGESNPQRLFDSLFASSTMPLDKLIALRARKKSVIDFVKQELTDFQARMGKDDRAKIEGHLASMRQLETQLGADSKTCPAPTTNATSKEFQDVIKAMCDIAAMAMRCDLTRVVSMVWGANDGNGPGSFPFLNVTADYHGVAHEGPDAYAQKIKIDRWYYTQVANLATQLDATTEGAETALDHSVIAVANGMNEGSRHFVGGLPFVLIGSAGGYFGTGRVVRLGSWAAKSGEYWKSESGVPHNKLLATLSNAMDVPVTSYGNGYAGTLDQLAAPKAL
ncbi:MAG TPA: DUF1552 domain-containing protein [Polyangiaceae bacterium]|nr:DUF1552 domain-containing protein [Polyangiaceae bacterium]